MPKIALFPLLIALSVAAAGTFGMLHNQLSVSVGPAYFTAFKFPQFGLPDTTGLRTGAAQVGWQASWWMGLIAGTPVMLYGLIRCPTPQAYLAGGLGAIGTVIFTATLAALFGLFVGIMALAFDVALPFAIPAGTNPEHFIRAGAMHDATYLGGTLGALLAFWPMHRAARG